MALLAKVLLGAVGQSLGGVVPLVGTRGWGAGPCGRCAPAACNEAVVCCSWVYKSALVAGALAFIATAGWSLSRYWARFHRPTVGLMMFAPWLRNSASVVAGVAPVVMAFESGSHQLGSRVAYLSCWLLSWRELAMVGVGLAYTCHELGRVADHIYTS